MDAKPRRRSPEELEHELEKIYADKDGQLPDFTKLDGKQGSRLKSWVFGLAAFFVVLAGVAWAGFFLFIRPSPFTGEKVSLRVESSGSLMAGGETELKIRYGNEEKAPLADASVAMAMPDGFVFVSSEPPLNAAGRWNVGSVAPGGEGAITVRGWTRRSPGETVTFQAEMEYKPADFNSQFKKVASHTAAVDGSVFILSATGTDMVVPGEKAEFVFSYENASDRAFEKMRFELEPLEGFVFESASPAADAETESRWALAAVPAKAKGDFRIRGTFSTSARGPKRLKAKLGFVQDDAFIAAASAEAATEVPKSDLAIGLIVNGSDKPPAVSFGDVLHFSLTYKNTGDVNLKEMTLSAELPSEPANGLLDWVTLKDEKNGVRKGSTITWTKTEIEGLELVKPGDEGLVNFTVQIAKKPEASATSTKYVIDAIVRAKVAKTAKIPAREVVSEPLVIRLNSDAVFKAYGRYFTEDGTPLGSGPLPPKVGEETVYRVNWVIQNTLHELASLSISTILPQGVSWTGVARPVDAGALTFDETGRKATWRLNRLPTSAQTVNVTFDVKVTPGFEDIGDILDLTGDSRFEALDKETESVILKTQPPIGTDLLGDENASGKGVVRE
jgi:hypothetical protein